MWQTFLSSIIICYTASVFNKTSSGFYETFGTTIISIIVFYTELKKNLVVTIENLYRHSRVIRQFLTYVSRPVEIYSFLTTKKAENECFVDDIVAGIT